MKNKKYRDINEEPVAAKAKNSTSQWPRNVISAIFTSEDKNAPLALMPMG